MSSLNSFWLLLHLVGLALGVGAATVKVGLLLKCKPDGEFAPVYLQVNRPITRILIAGLILLTLSGIGWLIAPGGYAFTPLLITKIVLVVALWIIGPVIDNVLEPKFTRLAPRPGEAPSPEFVEARRQLVFVECGATGLFYVVVLLGVWLTP